MIRLLDLFCGAGGAAVGYHRAFEAAGIEHEIVGVDIHAMPRYPFEFHQADAMEYPLEGFDVIHASPPCQRWSSKTRSPGKHPDFVTPLRKRLRGKNSVIENVVGAPLIDPVMLCGSMLNLRVRRHRLFEAAGSRDWQIPCDHFWQDADPRFLLYDHGKWFWSGIVHVFGTGGGKSADDWPEAMQIDWMTRDELTQAIPPAYTQYIGEQLLRTANIEAKAGRYTPPEGATK